MTQPTDDDDGGPIITPAPLDIDNSDHLAFIDDAQPLALTDEEYRIEIEELYALGELAKTDWPAGDDLAGAPPAEEAAPESAEAQLQRLAAYLDPLSPRFAAYPLPEPGEAVVDYAIRLLESVVPQRQRRRFR